ncbi:MAG: hypothetical protein JWP09_687 [Candidatus Taylorbacteria bacterium]|nr:hypothetical protein [Candidatus Taylorbacteria bacterium]
MTKITNLQLVAVAALVFAIPAVSFGSTFAYVDQTGYVRTTEASDAYSAMLVAPNIDEHSGVLIMDDQSDYAIVGEHVDSV